MSETNTEEHRSWWLVWLVWACGAAGAAQVGKVPPALPGMIDSLGISLTLSGWIASTVSLIGIGIGVFAGRLSDRLGARNTISLGLLAISAGCILGTTATTASWLIATRILEGAGLVMVMASAPALMQRHAPAGQISMAMGIWGTFMPFGVASILLIAPFIIGGPGWQTLWQLAGVWALTTGAFAWSFLQPDPATKERSPLLADIQSILLRPAILVSGGCFALYAAIYLGVLSFIPVWLTETENLSLGWASTIAALFACCNILGNLTAGALIRRGWKPPSTYASRSPDNGRHGACDVSRKRFAGCHLASGSALLKQRRHNSGQHLCTDRTTNATPKSDGHQQWHGFTAFVLGATIRPARFGGNG